mgnify:FL=1
MIIRKKTTIPMRHPVISDFGLDLLFKQHKKATV